ncbi:hypothetical protein BJP36_36875 [Moorena producens JHB]|uniref:Uncharacterized protein n=1 Tax=Moorena producens (strain JHB) TaxID=1454205 RepID=A0A9Q9SU33_MOOP1|nr:hypothetical protein [Moorena producens]WAN69670.1 hypothetical protein BJP36_36875 [Moorena producens JHB]
MDARRAFSDRVAYWPRLLGVAYCCGMGMLVEWGCWWNGDVGGMGILPVPFLTAECLRDS